MLGLAFFAFCAEAGDFGVKQFYFWADTCQSLLVDPIAHHLMVDDVDGGELGCVAGVDLLDFFYIT